jgi:hypothetical protein
MRKATAIKINKYLKTIKRTTSFMTFYKEYGMQFLTIPCLYTCSLEKAGKFTKHESVDANFSSIFQSYLARCGENTNVLYD